MTRGLKAISIEMITYFTPSRIRMRQAEVKAMIRPRRIDRKVTAEVSVLERRFVKAGNDDNDDDEAD